MLIYYFKRKRMDETLSRIQNEKNQFVAGAGARARIVHSPDIWIKYDMAFIMYPHAASVHCTVDFFSSGAPRNRKKTQKNIYAKTHRLTKWRKMNEGEK